MKWPTKTDSCVNVSARERVRERQGEWEAGSVPVTTEGKGHISGPGQQSDTFSVSYSSMSLSVSCPAHTISNLPSTSPSTFPVSSARAAPGGGQHGGPESLTGYLWQKCKINDVWREIVAKKCAKLNFGLSKTLPLFLSHATRGDMASEAGVAKR